MKRLLFISTILFCAISISQVSMDGDQSVIILNNYDINNSIPELSDLMTIHAGDSVEGDFFAEMKFTPDGEEM